MSTKITPLGENVLIKMVTPEAKTASGIYIPENATNEPSQQGTVIAIGDSEKIKVKKGHVVIFKKYGGEEVTFEKISYVIVNAKDVIAIIE